MRVRLTETIMEGAIPKVTWREGRDTILWEKDTEIEMSDTSARKFIKAGKAVAVTDNAEAPRRAAPKRKR